MAFDSDRISVRARTIAIVGAGPSGVIAAKYLRAEKAFDKIVLLEQRSRPGGIWNYTGDQRDEDIFSIPQTDPNKGLQKPEWRPKDATTNGGQSKINGANGTTPSFLAPMYEQLETNIPRSLMRFQGLDWPQDSQLFPKHETVLKYIEDYSADVQHLVQYCTQVTNITPVDANSPTSPWTVTTTNLLTNSSTTSTFDAVIVANGHFIVPYVPPIPGVQAWNAAHPGRITHSKYYRSAAEFSGKKVVVVGNSASGADLSNQISEQCTLPLLWSTRSASLFSTTHGAAGGQDTKRREVAPIAAFLPETRGVVFEDGQEEHDIDFLVFATGYFYSLPFLQDVKPALITDGGRVNHTYRHVFFAPRPSLSFLALPQRVIPFPVAEAQAAVVARVYAGRLSLPCLAEMEEWERGVVEDMGTGRNFHLLNFPKDGVYINEMSTWALSVAERKAAGLEEEEGVGKNPPMWGAWEFWCRENFPAIRQAFGKLGRGREKVRDVKELGFNFEEYKREKERQEMETKEREKKII
ncbi:FAD/NAD(P)-binding domain-containing protein [Clathrospora elynae]|uniref:FAD/NAD(P)-binding domain-containing protein n=1 Tax=Clathrospora elynae TaxID=706981 RepID=A0A6A5T9F7_9PLEO|nr:FAD/NAD(P)-binding domain-containing protein [Clathrospora elynae]